MDLWQLHIFCKVVELKSFSKAGEAAYLSQPTVSSHIKDLETHFGTRLVDRLARQVVPTKAGELLYDYAHRLLALRDEAESALADFLGKIKGRLLIGGSTIPGGYLLPRLIGQFAQIYPEVQVALVVADTDEIVDKIAGGRIEVGIVGARSDDKQIRQEPLVEDDLRLAVPSDHKWAKRKRVALKELLNEPFIVRERGSGTLRSLEQPLRQAGLDLDDFKIVAELGSTEAVRQGIKNKVGLSVLSAIALTDDVEAGFLRSLSIDGLNLKRYFYLTTHKQRSTSPLCRAFIDFLKGVLASAA